MAQSQNPSKGPVKQDQKKSDPKKQDQKKTQPKK